MCAGTWINPMPAAPPDSEMAARLEMRVESVDEDRFTKTTDVGPVVFLVDLVALTNPGHARLLLCLSLGWCGHSLSLLPLCVGAVEFEAVTASGRYELLFAIYLTLHHVLLW